jgi:MFS family permease
MERLMHHHMLDGTPGGKSIRHLIQEYGESSKNIRILIASSLFSGMGMAFFNFVLVLYITTVSDARMFGLIGLIIGVVNGVSLIPSGILSDRVGAHRLIMLSAGLTTLGISLFLYSSTVAFVLGAALIGIAGALGGPSSNVYMASVTEQKRKYIFAMRALLSQVGLSIAFILGGSIPDILTSNGVDLVMAFQIVMALGALLNLISLFQVLRLTEEKDGEPQGKLKWPSRRVWLFTMPGILIGFGAGVTIPYFQVFFASVLGASKSYTGLIFGISNIVMAFVIAILPDFAARMGSVRLVVSCHAIATALMWVIPFFPVLWLASFIFIVRNVLMNAVNPITSAFMMSRVRPDERGIATSLSTLAWLTCNACGTYIGGFLWGNNGLWFYAFIITGIFYSIYTGLYYIFFKTIDDLPTPKNFEKNP